MLTVSESLFLFNLSRKPGFSSAHFCPRYLMLTQLKGAINLGLVFWVILCFSFCSIQHVPLTYWCLSKQDCCTQVNSKSERECCPPVPLREKKLRKRPRIQSILHQKSTCFLYLCINPFLVVNIFLKKV